MCGIAGIISSNEERVRHALPLMVNAQIHRGPDDDGQEIIKVGKCVVGLGHRRLSIIDLSPAGHQPMVHPESGAHIIFNGEIYNFQELRKEMELEGAEFRGHSDTELLLLALVKWGPKCFDRIEGMYALAFYDPRQGQLLLARDPLGIKPLYVAFVGSEILFASEVRAIMASEFIERTPNVRAIAGLLAYGAIQEPCTFYEKIRAFNPGTYQIFDLKPQGTVQHGAVQQYWNFPSPIQNIPADEVTTQVRERFSRSVRNHLVSDVPIGVFLSSGLDSTIVAGVAASCQAKIKTFTVGFSDDKDMSEAVLAKETAGIFGTEHIEVTITAADSEKMALEWLESMDQPSIDGLNTHIISRAARMSGIIAALSGLGGDELFGGYETFTRVAKAMQICRRINWMPRWAKLAASQLATLGKPNSVKQKAVDIINANPNIIDLYFCLRRNNSNKQLDSLGLNAKDLMLTNNFIPPEALQNISYTDESDMVWAISQLESRFYMGNMLLRDCDTNSMASSLELRVPFLDRRMLDYVYALPGSIRLPMGKANKFLLRTCFSDLLRPALTTQKKRGFALPIGRWLVGPMREMCEEAIVYLKSTKILKPDGIDNIWDTFVKQPDVLREGRVFGLCILGLYCKYNRI